jgi:hypothetical protein
MLHYGSCGRMPCLCESPHKVVDVDVLSRHPAFIEAPSPCLIASDGPIVPAQQQQQQQQQLLTTGLPVTHHLPLLLYCHCVVLPVTHHLPKCPVV